MKTFISILLFTMLTTTSSIYSYHFDKQSGGVLELSTLQGKKILFVNIATTGERVDQLGALQQLQNLYADSLVVIAFPSNDFGNEPRSNEALGEYFHTMGYSFLLATKSTVKGESMHSIYTWLTKQSNNGAAESEVKSDFQKYLVSGSGELIGIYSGSLSPLSPQITNAISPAP